MKSLYKSNLSLIASAATISGVCFAQSVGFQHQPRPNESAAEFQARYGIQKSDMIIEQVNIDDRGPEDGPTNYQIKAQSLKSAEYVLVFENRDERNEVFEMKKIRFSVQDKRAGIDESKRLVVLSPDESVWKTYLAGREAARLGNPILIKWSWYSGGEGIAGGWYLSKIERAK